jgi:hypothetical protein
MIQQSHSWAYIQINYNSNRYMHPVFITALFIKAKTWKQHKCPLTEEWIKKERYINACIYIYIQRDREREVGGMLLSR